jgi:pimeloyl-ACP methyl ester carboxylesterase
VRIDLGDVRLWFDVDGLQLVPDGAEMRTRPVVVVLHGGPGFDHTLYKDDLWRLTDVAQVVYLDQRGHGRSDRGREQDWSLERWADDVRAFCDVLGIERPVVWGHSFGALVAAAYAARHPGHPGGLVLQAVRARFEVGRIAEGFRRVGGYQIGELARRYYTGDPTATGEFLTRALPLVGPWVPGEQEMARATMNEQLLMRGRELVARDLTGTLAGITCPTLVCVGSRDPSAQVADAREVAARLPDDRVDVEVFVEGGHFLWKDVPDRYWPVVHAFVAGTATGRPPAASGTG